MLERVGELHLRAVEDIQQARDWYDSRGETEAAAFVSQRCLPFFVPRWLSS
jgi:hypothetical protein